MELYNTLIHTEQRDADAIRQFLADSHEPAADHQLMTVFIANDEHQYYGRRFASCPATGVGS